MNEPIANTIKKFSVIIETYENILKGVFTDGYILTVSTMKYMNQINNRTIKITGQYE